jgi:hypothetical protein
LFLHKGCIGTTLISLLTSFILLRIFMCILLVTYITILKDRTAPIFCWKLNHPPKPYVFVSIPLQSGPLADLIR